MSLKFILKKYLLANLVPDGQKLMTERSVNNVDKIKSQNVNITQIMC